MPVLMPSPVFRWFVPATGSTGLVPAAVYKAKFYSAGTATAKAIYDANGTIYPSPSNTAVLNAQGYAEIKLGPGSYKIVVTDPSDVPVFTQDNLSGEGSFGTGFVNTVIASDTSGLKDADSTSNHFVWCAGYYAIGDGGHGFFYNQTSSTPDDTGYVIASVFDPTKRWFRVPDESGDVRAESFGYIGTKSGNLSFPLLAAAAYCTSYDKRLRIGTGSTAIIGTDTSDFYIYAPEIYLEPGSMLTGTGLFTNLVLQGRVSGSAEQHFATNFQAIFGPRQTSENPEWFGASYDSLDNTAAFARWFASQAGAYVLPPGVWAYANTTSFPFPTVPFTMLGTIDATTGNDIPSGIYYQTNSIARIGEVLLHNTASITKDGGTGMTLTGSVGVAGSMATTAGNGITSGGAVTADSDIAAGVGVSGGRLTARAGTAARRFAAGGRIVGNLGSASNVSTTITNLLTATIDAQVLIDAGSMVRITAFCKGTGSSGAKTIGIYLGATAIAGVAGTFAVGGMNLVCDLYLTSTGNYAAYWTGICQATGIGTPAGTEVDSLTGTADFTTNQTITCKGTSNTGTGTITNVLLTLDFFPAPV